MRLSAPSRKACRAFGLSARQLVDHARWGTHFAQYQTDASYQALVRRMVDSFTTTSYAADIISGSRSGHPHAQPK